MKRVQLNDYGESLGGLQVYAQSRQQEGDRREQLRQVVRKASRNELTARQQEMVHLYYFKGMTMTEIARQLGVNKSTVSRVLKAAQRRIAPCVRYWM